MKLRNVTILITFVVICALIWYFAALIKHSNAPTARTEENQVHEMPKSETIPFMVNTDNTKYLYEIAGKKKIEAPTAADFSSFAGYPKAVNEEKTLTDEPMLLYSNNQLLAIAISKTRDKTKPISDFDGQHPVVAEKYYLCDLETKGCTVTSILDEANKQYPQLKDCWINWDSKNNWFFGEPCGEGAGPSYIAKYDVYKKTIEKVGNDYDAQGKTTVTGPGAYSPSLEHFFITSHDLQTKKTEALIYSTKNLKDPEKRIDISQAFDLSNNEYPTAWPSVWTRDEKHIYFVAARLKIFDIDVTMSEVVPKAKETSASISSIVLSSGERYLAYVYLPQGYGEKQVLKAVDLKDNNKVSELFREEYISIYQ